MAKSKKAKPEAKRPSKLMVRIGWAELSSGKLAASWRPISQEQFAAGELPDAPKGGDAFYHSRAMKSAARPGGVVRFEYDADNPGTLYTGGECVGLLNDDETRARLQAEAEAVKLAYDLGRQAKKDDAALDCLEPLRDAYNRLRTRPQRAAFLAAVVLRIQS